MIDKVKGYFRAGNFRYPAMAAVAVIFLFAGLVLASSMKLTPASQAVTAERSITAPGAPASFADLAESLGPAVVNIKVTKIQKTDFSEFPDMPGAPFGDMFKHFFGRMPRGGETFKTQGAGSGVIINADGTVLTNYHVVDGAKEITVTMSDKKEYKARTVGKDPKTDLAVLRIDGKGTFKPAALGDSERLRVGEWVLAIGNPFGLSNTVTSGIVSAKGRVIGAGPYDDFIQTDAPINPGNSGGPLFNMKGEVVGINTAIIPNGQGIGFAIPASTVKRLVPELVARGGVTRGYLGVSVQNVSGDLSKSLGLRADKGALVSEVVEGAPAEKGGIRQGDVIVSFDGKEIKESHELSAAVAATPVGKDVSVGLMRDGKNLTVTVKTGKLPSDEVAARTDDEGRKGRWGLALKDLDPETSRRLGMKAKQGVVVAGVEPGSPADQASIEQGDVILEVNRKQVKNVEDIRKEMDKADSKGQTLLLVRRGGHNLYVVLAG